MRFSGNIIFLSNGKEEYKIPTNYRISISSLLKEAINRHDATGKVYDKYFKDKKPNKSKPYTYSVFIPYPEHKKEKTRNYLISKSNKITLHFSSNDYELSTAVYNGLIQINNDNRKAMKSKDKSVDKFSLFDYPLGIRNFYLKLDPGITSNKVKFKTLSPVVLRKLENKRGVGYVTFMDKEFRNMLFLSIQNLCRNFIDEDFTLSESDYEVNLINPKVVKVYHYGDVIPATKATIELTCPVEILQLVYDVGLGARRSQGFGMLEVV